MANRDPDRVSKGQPITVRLGRALFQRRAAGLPPVVRQDAIQLLNRDERVALLRIERGTVTRAALVGGISGLCSAVAEILASPYLGDASLLSRGAATYWGIVLGVTVVATTLEVGYLYLAATRSAQDMARTAGADLFGGGPLERALVTPLVRAALELPNPTGPELGIHPYQEISRWRVALSKAMYRVKISVTNLGVRMVILRLLGRAALRSMLPLVSVPVTLAWNAWVMSRVLRQARLRILGPFAAEEILETLSADLSSISRRGGLNLARAVGVVVVRKRDMHPNLVSLLHQVVQRLDIDEPDDQKLSDVPLFLGELAALPRPEQVMTVRMLAVAVILDGQLGQRELQLLRVAHEQVAGPLDEDALRTLHRRFIRGDEFDRSVFERIGAPLGRPS